MKYVDHSFDKSDWSCDGSRLRSVRKSDRP